MNNQTTDIKHLESRIFYLEEELNELKSNYARFKWSIIVSSTVFILVVLPVMINSGR